MFRICIMHLHLALHPKFRHALVQGQTQCSPFQLNGFPAQIEHTQQALAGALAMTQQRKDSRVHRQTLLQGFGVKCRVQTAFGHQSLNATKHTNGRANRVRKMLVCFFH